MTLEQLRIFVEVADREHMTRAAEALNVTQSAASAAIAALETRHGVPLFHRVGRGIELTEAGAMFREEARAIMARVASAEVALSEYGGLRRGTLRLVASQTIASYWLPARLAEFRRCHPQITVELAIDNTVGAAERVLDGRAELGFVEGDIDNPALAHWKVGEDRMVLVACEPVESVDEEWVRSAQWIMREQGSGTRSTFANALRNRGIAPADLQVAMTLPSNEAVRSAVEAGAGVAVLSELVVRRALAVGHLHHLPISLASRPFQALRHKERYRTRAADALIDLVKEFGP